MSVNYSKLRSLPVLRMMKALDRDGFEIDRIAGSHHHYLHADGRRVTVTFHGSGSTFKFKTLKRIVEDQAKWTENDLKRLGLLK